MKSVKTAIIPSLILLLALTVQANQTVRITMILVNGPNSGWPEQDLRGKLERLVTARSDFELVPAIETEMLMREVDGHFHKDRLIDWGVRIDCRYIVWFDVIREELNNEDNFSIPLLLNQKRLTASLDLDYRILDCFRGRLLHVDDFSGRRYGPSAMQLIDDVDAHPALHMDYFERKRLFDRLEQDAVNEVFAHLERIAKQR